MYELEIEFVDSIHDKNPFKLQWDIVKSPSAGLWLKCFTDWLDSPYQLFPRFLGFVNTNRNLGFIAQELQKSIDIINEDGRYKIEEHINDGLDRDFFNKIHHHFEILSGPGISSTEYTAQSSAQVRRAVGNLNYYIHEMESYEKSHQDMADNEEFVYAAICLEFEKWNKMLKIPSFCDDDFSLDVDFGDLVLHYCQRGKTWWEVFLDDDEEIFEENILELQFVNGEFDMIFGDLGDLTQKKKEFANFLKEHGKEIDDSKLRLGFNTIAKLKTPFTKKSKLQAELGNKNGIRTFTLLKDGAVFKQKAFSELFNCETNHWVS